MARISEILNGNKVSILGATTLKLDQDSITTELGKNVSNITIAMYKR